MSRMSAGVCVCLYIGTQFINLYTAVDTPPGPRDMHDVWFLYVNVCSEVLGPFIPGPLCPCVPYEEEDTCVL